MILIDNCGCVGARCAPGQLACGRQETLRIVRGVSAAAAGPVEPRTTSSGSKSSSSLETGAPPIWLTRSATALVPIFSIGCLTVVRGGSVQLISAESSKPTTDTSPGTD